MNDLDSFLDNEVKNLTNDKIIDLFEHSTIKYDSTIYNIIKILGRGISGAVFIAMTETNKLCAIKISQSDNSQEIRCLKSVSDICGKYILCMQNTFEKIIKNNKYYFLVTDYEPGYVTLNQYFKVMFIGHTNIKGKFEHTLDNFITITNNIKKVYRLLHRFDIFNEELPAKTTLHQDIKFGNLLVNIYTLDIKIIDLGFCIIINKMSKEGDPDYLTKANIDFYIDNEKQGIESVLREIKYKFPDKIFEKYDL